MSGGNYQSASYTTCAREYQLSHEAEFQEASTTEHLTPRVHGILHCHMKLTLMVTNSGMIWRAGAGVALAE